MTPSATMNGVYGENSRGEDILPGKLMAGIRIFLFKGIGKMNCAVAHRKVKIVLGFDLIKMQAQALNQNIREHRHAVIFLFPSRTTI